MLLLYYNFIELSTYVREILQSFIKKDIILNMKKLEVTSKYDGKKLSSYLLNTVDNLSNNLFYKTLRKKDIKINGKRISKDVVLNEGDEVLVYIDDKLLMPKQDLQIIYEDENILIIDKPYNLEVTGENSLTSIVHDLYKGKEFEPMPCHRIDRNTVGLVVFAKMKKHY